MMNRKLGINGPLVSAVGLGCMGMSGAYGQSAICANVIFFITIFAFNFPLKFIGKFIGNCGTFFGIFLE
jgi:hypothetical protein